MDILEELLAERELRKIIALYPQYADDGRAQDFAALFTPDGEIVIGETVAKGHEAIAAWLEKTLKGLPMRHMMLNSHIELVSAEEARGSLDMALLVFKDRQWVVGPTPRYNDSYSKTADGWKFARRSLTMK